MQNVKHIPSGHTQVFPVTAVGAGDATEEQVIGIIPFNAVLRWVSIIPSAGVTGDDTNRKNLNVKVGGTEVANLDLATGTDLTVDAENQINTTELSTTLTKGVPIKLEIEQVGTGVAIPASHVLIEFSSR